MSRLCIKNVKVSIIKNKIIREILWENEKQLKLDCSGGGLIV